MFKDFVTREIGVLRQMKHEGVLELFGIYETPSEIQYVFNLLTGGELGNKMR